jgi:phage gp29-like protein
MFMAEIGRIGQLRYGGIFYEEFLPELQGIRGMKAYREMADNDDTVGAIMFAIKMLIRHVSWNVEPGGDSAKDREAAEFVESCMYDMQCTWTDTISEILSFLVYGWSFHEIVYKRRMGKTRNRRTNSKYSDSLIGWQKLPVRSQDTLYQWEYDTKDNLMGMTQMPPPDFGLFTIPIQKALLFRTESAKDNPEGRSILRNAYRPWYFKRRIQEIEAIGIERDLAGLPVFYAKDGMDIWDADDPEMVRLYTMMLKMVKNIRRDEYEGLVLPHGFEFELVSTGGTRQFDTNAIINRYDTKIAQTVLADFIMLGHEKVGSFALSSDKTELFSVAISSFLDIICETFNSQGIPTLIDMNGSHFEGITDYPEMRHGDIEEKDIQKVGQYIRDMVGIGILVPDDGLEDYAREIGGLPERTADTRTDDPRRTKQQNQSQPPEKDSGKEKNDELPEDDIKAAKSRLGREK